MEIAKTRLDESESKLCAHFCRFRFGNAGYAGVPLPKLVNGLDRREPNVWPDQRLKDNPGFCGLDEEKCVIFSAVSLHHRPMSRLGILA